MAGTASEGASDDAAWLAAAASPTVERFYSFYRDKLLPDLSAARARRNDLQDALRDVRELERRLRCSGEGASPQHADASDDNREGSLADVEMVDLGQGVFAHACIETGARIHLFVGLGFYVECSDDEARGASSRRTSPIVGHFSVV